MSKRKALIIGTSIAGPSTAHFLSLAGYHITIIERSPFLRPGGQAVDIRLFGVTVMRKIPGLEASILSASNQEDGIAFVNQSGDVLGVIRSTGNPSQQGLVSEYEIDRGKLSRVLVDLTKHDPNVQYIFGETISSFSPIPDSSDITVEFTNGTPTQTFDLVVACDGAHSRTRAMAFNCAVRKYMWPVNTWAAYFSIPSDLLDGSNIGHGFSTPGGLFISLSRDPDRGNKVMLMAVNQSDENMEKFKTAVMNGDDALKDFVIERYKGVGWKTAQVLLDMLDSEDFYASEIVQVKPPTLHAGRVVLVGDAGYAAGPTGGGTSLAMVGGYMLAGALSNHLDNIESGLKEYEERMKPLIDEMQKIPPFVGTIMAPQTWWGIVLRNWIFAVVAWTGVAGFVQRYLGAAFADSNEYPLPEFEWMRS
jgi:2-polyprenyl-6-methoxyphenol hydroxylase-like FAD-dependent oxidoreductase